MATTVLSGDDQRLETFRLLWLDDNPKEGQNTEQKLRSIISPFHKFQTISECQDLIEKTSDRDRLIIIVNGRLGRELVPAIHNMQQVVAIYVYCMNKQRNEEWSSKYAKVKAVVITFKELVSRLQFDHRSQEKVEESFSYNTFDPKSGPGTSTSGLNGQFVFTEILIDCLLRLKANETDRKELIRLCKSEYEENEMELSNIDAFEKTYSSNDALVWYTKDTFFYRVLNRALRNQNIHMIYLLRSYIFDLHGLLRRYQSKSFLRVYRGQLMSNDELTSLQNRLGQFISINSFFSTSVERQTALHFLAHSKSSINLEKVLFQISADPKKVKTKPFAEISKYSEFEYEEEVLFMLGSIFRLKKIYQDDDGIWNIELMLCSDDEHELQEVFMEMKSDKADLRTFANILLEMGKFNLAEIYFLRYLETLSSTDPMRITLYKDLAKTAAQKGDYDVSMKWQQKSVEFKQQNQGIGSSIINWFFGGSPSVSKSTPDLSSKPPTYENVQLEWKIHDNKKKAAIDLGEMKLTDKDMEVVSYYLVQNNQTLTTLYLSRNRIGDKGARHLGEALRHNSTLTVLELWSNQIGAEGARYLAVALQKNTTLTTLYLHDNQTGDKGAQYLGEALQHNTALTTLDLHENQIGDKGAQYLGLALQHNTTLTTLDLSFNQIGDRGAEYIGEALRNNTTLTTLDLSSNQIEEQWKKYQKQILNKKINFSLRM